MAGENKIDFVLRTVEERNICFIRLWFTDVLGNLKSFAISPEDLEEAFLEGVGFDGSAVEGFTPLEQSDMLAFPDPETFQVLPWGGADCLEARMICDIKTPSGESFSGDPRYCLEKMFRKAEKLGYVFMVGPELEYFYFDNCKQPIPKDNASYFDLTPFDSARNLRRNTILTLEKMSIPVAYSYHAVAPSQNGIQFRYAEGRTCADNIITARHVIKQEAYMDEKYASFMPKPIADRPGSAFFLHESLFNHSGENLFYGGESADDLHLSELARQFIAGILKYAPEFMLVTNPTVNSYKRLLPSGQVPVRATWGRRNRSALVRIPTYKPGKPESSRIEVRVPDPTCNPYLGFAVTLGAGLKGIEEGLELQLENTGACDTGAVCEDLPLLPQNLGEALGAFKQSDLMREILGDHIFEYLLESKTEEWSAYNSWITDWEKDHYYAGF